MGIKIRSQIGTKNLHYIGNFVYEGSSLKYILQDEGRIVVNGSSAIYEYYLKDHLGNTSVAFQENQSNPIQSTDYYPFGLALNMSEGLSNKYLYNGKELQEETDWLDYGARMYDAQLGRWMCLDPLANKYYSYSPFSYTLNNPILFVDPDGRKVKIFYFQSGVKAGVGMNLGYTRQAGMARDDRGITRFEIQSNQYFNNNIEEGTRTPEVYGGFDVDLFSLGYASDSKASTFKEHMNKMSYFSLNSSLVDVSFTGNTFALEVGLSLGGGFGNSGNPDKITSISYSLEEAAFFAKDYGAGQFTVNEAGLTRGEDGEVTERYGHLIFNKSDGTVIETGIQVTSYNDPESINRFWETYLYRYQNDEDDD